MITHLPERLLSDSVTIRRSVQSFVASTKRPVFQFQVVQTGVKARFNPASTSLNRNVLGQTPKKAFRLFLNPIDLKENDEVIDESTGEVFVVTEAKNFFGHHMEVFVEEKQK
jgi:hypothetical protein